MVDEIWPPEGFVKALKMVPSYGYSACIWCWQTWQHIFRTAGSMITSSFLPTTSTWDGTCNACPMALQPWQILIISSRSFECMASLLISTRVLFCSGLLEKGPSDSPNSGSNAPRPGHFWPCRTLQHVCRWFPKQPTWEWSLATEHRRLTQSTVASRRPKYIFLFCGSGSQPNVYRKAFVFACTNNVYCQRSCTVSTKRE